MTTPAQTLKPDGGSVPKGSPAKPAKRMRTARGRHPRSLSDPNMEKILSMVVALSAEVSALRDRLDSHERLAAVKGIFSGQDVDHYHPDDAVESERQQWRQRYLKRVFRMVTAELDEIERKESEASYMSLVKEVEEHP